MKKVIISILVVVGVILLSIGSYYLYQYIRVKTAKIEIVLREDKTVEFLSAASVSTFIESINGDIVDDYNIDTTTLGSKTINFRFINDDNIELEYSYEIEVVDTVAPLVWLGKSYNITVGSTDSLLDKILCGDNYDSKPQCVIEGEYDLNTVGSYDLVFVATDSSQNVTRKEFTLNVNKSSSSSSSSSRSKTLFSDIVANYKTDNNQIGIDVSKWQGDIDFKALKAAGVEFIIIRVGSSSGSNGDNFVDSKFIQNIENANEEGIPVGVYFYSYAADEKRAKSDALWVVEQIKDYDVELGVAFDWENWSSFNDYNLSFFGLTSLATTFLDTVLEYGYEGILYSSKNYLEEIWLPTNYQVWLAHYVTNTTYMGEYNYWQMCNNGRVDGINGDVDINIRYLD